MKGIGKTGWTGKVTEMLLDTSAWVEFMEGTEKGKAVKELLKAQDSFTSLTSVSEFVQWCLRNRIQNVNAYLEAIKENTRLLGITEEISIAAGKLNYERKKAGKKWGMIDSIITATAQTYGLRILTKDSHFRDLADVQLL